MMAAEGPAVVSPRERGKASVFDVAPTLCRLLGLPPDPAFEGKPVAGLGGAALPKAAGPGRGRRPPRSNGSSSATWAPNEKRAAEEFDEKLISLGYLTGSEAAAVDARPADRAGTETTGHYQNLATFLRARGRYAESLPLYGKALEINPKSASAWMNLSIALFHLDRWVEADEALVKALQNGYNDPEGAFNRRVSTYMQRIERQPAVREASVQLERGGSSVR